MIPIQKKRVFNLRIICNCVCNKYLGRDFTCRVWIQCNFHAKASVGIYWEATAFCFPQNPRWARRVVSSEGFRIFKIWDYWTCCRNSYFLCFYSCLQYWHFSWLFLPFSFRASKKSPINADRRNWPEKHLLFEKRLKNA